MNLGKIIWIVVEDPGGSLQVLTMRKQVSSRRGSLPQSRNDSSRTPLPRVSRWPQYCKQLPWCLSLATFSLLARLTSHLPIRRWNSEIVCLWFLFWSTPGCFQGHSDPSTSLHTQTDKRLDRPPNASFMTAPLLLSFLSKAPSALTTWGDFMVLVFT